MSRKNTEQYAEIRTCKAGSLMLRQGKGWILRIDEDKNVNDYVICAKCKEDITQGKKYYCETNDLMFCEWCDHNGSSCDVSLAKNLTHMHHNIISIQIAEGEQNEY